MYKKHFRLSQKKIIFYRQTSSPRIVPLKKCDLSKCKSRKKNTGIQEYVFARALGNPNLELYNTRIIAENERLQPFKFYVK